MRRSDRYFANKYHQQERRDRECCEEDEQVRQDYHTWTNTTETHWHDAWDYPVGLYAGTEGQDRECRHGYPLGWGQPEEVPQAFWEAFHSAQEESLNLHQNA